MVLNFSLICVYTDPYHRRHKQNHETQLPCSWPSCGKTFHRQDLLERHLATKQYVFPTMHISISSLLTAPYSNTNQPPTGTPRRFSSVSGSSSSHSGSRSVDPTGRNTPAISVIAPSVASSYIPVSTQQAPSYIPHPSSESLRYQQPIFYDQSGSDQFSSNPFVNFIV
jgi:hypothetical protein